MKSFPTLCMATAMIGTALNAGAVTRGTVLPFRTTPLGDSIYGYLGYCDESADYPVGYYELQPKGAKLLWKDPFTEETKLACNNVAKIDGRIVGYVQDQILGMLFGIYYVEYDAATGEVLKIDEQDIGFNRDYIGVFAYNPEDDTFYGYGSCDGVRCYLSAPAWNPFDYRMIKRLQGREMCISMCYNPVEKAMVGVNLNYELVKIGKDGRQTKIMDLDVRNGDTYVTGLTYSPRSDVYYWNINYTDGTAAMATIDPVGKTLNVYENLMHCEEYYNLFTTDEYVGNPDGPSRPEAGAPDFGKGDLTGYVDFTLPSKTKGGDYITGEVEYTTYLNGEPYASGTAAIGGRDGDGGDREPVTVRADFTVPEAGRYSFGMSVRANGLESEKAFTNAWIGNDIPAPPTDVRLTKSASGTAGSYAVTWNPVTEGAHGGYLDLDELRYQVRINGEEHTVAEPRLDIILPADRDLEAYAAEVRAVCGGNESDWISSNTVTEGTPLSLPAFISPTPDQFEVSTVIDGNRDSRTWSLQESADPDNPYYIMSSFTNDRWKPMDDWYFLPKMRIDDAETFHSFSMEVALGSSSFPNEFVEVMLCGEPSPDGIISTVIKEFKPLSAGFEKTDGLFRVPQAGDYYIGLHCKSDGLQMGVLARNFEVESSEATFDSPAAVKELDVTPGRKGALKAAVVFQMPTMNIGNGEIPPETILEATVSSPVGSMTVKGKPGQKVSATVDTEQGYNVITVQVSDGERKSLVTKTSVFTGVHIPATPRMTSVEHSPDMLSMTLDWEPVVTADDGESYVDPETVVYDIYMLDMAGNRWILHREGVTESSYSFEVEPGNAQELVMLGVLSRNAAGDNGELVTAMGVLGTPYDLPLVEDFDDDGNLYSNPWLTTYLYGDGGSWGLYYTSDVTGDSTDKGVSMVALGDNGVVSRLGTPRFTTAGLDGASITLELLNTNMPDVRILAETYGDEEPEVIGDFDGRDFKNRYEKVTVALPERYLGREWAGLYIETEFYDENQILVIESVSIDGASDSVRTVGGEEDLRIVTGKGLIKVTDLKGREVTVTDVNGIVVGKACAADEALFHVEEGIYIVSSCGRNAKVAVR